MVIPQPRQLPSASAAARVIGPSGAGKSTLLGAADRHAARTSGAVTYDERDFYTHTTSCGTGSAWLPQENTSAHQLSARKPSDKKRNGGVTSQRDVQKERAAAPGSPRCGGDVPNTARGDHRPPRCTAGPQKRVSRLRVLTSVAAVTGRDHLRPDPGPGDKSVMERWDLAHEGRTVNRRPHHSVANRTCAGPVLVLVRAARFGYFGAAEDALKPSASPAGPKVSRPFPDADRDGTGRPSTAIDGRRGRRKRGKEQEARKANGRQTRGTEQDGRQGAGKRKKRLSSS